jgi:uncharacterized membrane protein YdjX (TVP38/TMEM64 family)
MVGLRIETRQSHPTPVAPLSGDASPVDHVEGLEELGQEAALGVGRERRQIALLVMVVAAFMAIAHFTPLKAWLENAQEWKRAVQGLGWRGNAGFLALTAVLVALGVPRLTLCGTAGLLFGFAEGMVVSLIGSTLGSYGTFVAVRRGFRRSVTTQAARRPWLARLLQKPSLLKVFWVRQLALPGVVLNAVLAVSEIRHRIFLGGTLLGYVPLNAAATLVGSGLGKASLQQTMVQLMAALAVINLVMWWVWRRFKRRPVETTAASANA